MPKKILFSLIRATISVSLICLILWRADLGAVMVAVSTLDARAVVAALASIILGLLVRALKWHLLLRVQDAREPFGTAWRVIYMSTFFNNLFLGTLGGDAFRVYHAKAYSRSAGGAASALILERAFGLLAGLMLVFSCGILLASEEVVTAKLLLAMTAVGALAIVFVAITFLAGPRLARIPILRRARAVTDFAAEVSISLGAYKAHPALVTSVVLLSLTFYGFQSITVHFFALAAGEHIPFLSLLFITPLSGILAVLPISINGIGVREGTLVFYLEQIGIPGPAALLIALLGRIGNLIMSLIGGVFVATQYWGIRRSRYSGMEAFGSEEPTQK